MSANEVNVDLAQKQAAAWATEYCDEAGTAFSYQIVRHCHHEKTPFQTIDIVETKHFGHAILIDGFTQLTQRDIFIYHEMMVHPVLFAHPMPRSVAVIGGGDCGTLREVLRHPRVTTAWQIEIDERVTALSQHYFPELTAANDDPRANLLFVDGIQWMAEQADASLDVIIVDATDPIGPAEGLYNQAFYQQCLRVLAPQGLLIAQSESPILHRESIIQPMQTAMLQAGFTSTSRLYFPQPCYPLGWWTATIACQQTQLPTPDWSAVATRPFKTAYYNADIHRAASAVPQFMSEQLEGCD